LETISPSKLFDRQKQSGFFAFEVLNIFDLRLRAEQNVFQRKL